LNIGVDLGGRTVSILMYAGDIALIANYELNLQTMLEKLSDWSSRWRVTVNTSKSMFVHFRRGRASRTEFRFHLGADYIETVNKYKYLGVLFSEKR
jgi:Reverse transcriptase (RNA-dependent DNA polymerase)